MACALLDQLFEMVTIFGQFLLELDPLGGVDNEPLQGLELAVVIEDPTTLFPDPLFFSRGGPNAIDQLEGPMFCQRLLHVIPYGLLVVRMNQLSIRNLSVSDQI